MIYAMVCDFPFIAEVHNSAKVWISYSEYTIAKQPIDGKINTIGECRYDSDIPKNQNVFDLGYVYSIGSLEKPNLLRILCRTR